MMNRVYKYGCLAPTLNAEVVYEQIRSAHQYRNQLVEIERVRREAIKAAEKAALADPSVDLKAVKDRINTEAADKRRAARASTPCYWGTYLLIEGSDDQARKAKDPPSFQSWQGDGAVAMQIQKGMSPSDLVNDRRAQLTTPTARGHAVLRLRVGSDESRDPIWAEWPIIVHRPIPEDAIIKGVSVHMRRRGRKTVWSAEFSLMLPAAVRTCGKGAVGVDLAWRMIDGDERVCAYANEDGTDVGELRLTAYELGGFDRVESLASTRSTLRNDLQAALQKYRASGLASPWFVEETRYLHVWKSAGKYFRLRKAIRENNSNAEASALVLLDAFCYRDTHLSDWECNQRQKNLDHRKAKYAEFAAWLARKYETLILEDFDLRTFARKPAKDAKVDDQGRRESHQAEKARAQRHEAATSILRSILRNAFERRGGTVIVVSAVDTTRTCGACGLVVDRDFAASVDWTCACGAVHDQDVNASNNLCERWRAQEKAGAARGSTGAKRLVKRESKWSRLKRTKLEKEAARDVSANSAG
jgi:putative transposase